MPRVNGYRVKQAREFRRWRQQDLAQHCDVSQSAVGHVERGILEPSDELLSRIADRTQFPEEFFLACEPVRLPESSTLAYRQVKSRLNREDRRYLHNLADLSLVASESLRSAFKVPACTLHVLEGEDYKTAAALTRSALGYSPEAPISQFIHSLECNGVVCLAIPCGELGNAFDAFVVRVNQRPVIVLNPEMPAARIRATVAHEVGHYVLNHSPGIGSRKVNEHEAWLFASEFLFPEESARNEILDPVTLSALANLKPRWGVSIKFLIRLANSLGITKDHQARYLYIRYGKLWGGTSAAEPGDNLIPPERPRALRVLLDKRYGVDIGKFASDISLPRMLVNSIVSVHGKPRENDSGGSVLEFARSI